MSTTVSSILMSPPRHSVAATSHTGGGTSSQTFSGDVVRQNNSSCSLEISSHPVPAFAHSSPFLRTARLRDVSATTRATNGVASLAVDAIIPDSMQLTSPARWGGSDVAQGRPTTAASRTANDDDTQRENLHSRAEITATSSTTVLGMTSSYMKEYDYSQPTVSMKLSDNGRHVAPSKVAPQTQNRVSKSSPRQPVVLHQRAYSAQVQRAREQNAVIAAASQGTPRELLYKGLPYTWRELVPFSCPVTHPELMSYDPSGYHSAVARQTRDIGMRMVDLEAGRRHRSLEGLDLNAERGVTGLSLEKHVKAYRMTQVGTYPGFSYGLSS
jgi:hypothetical protein